MSIFLLARYFSSGDNRKKKSPVLITNENGSINSSNFKKKVKKMKFSKGEILKINRVSNLIYGKIHERTKRLIARLIDEEQYLLSPDFSVTNKIGKSEVDFSEVNNLNGIYFDYDENNRYWKLSCINPYIKFE